MGAPGEAMLLRGPPCLPGAIRDKFPGHSVYYASTMVTIMTENVRLGSQDVEILTQDENGPRMTSIGSLFVVAPPHYDQWSPVPEGPRVGRA